MGRNSQGCGEGEVGHSPDSRQSAPATHAPHSGGNPAQKCCGERPRERQGPGRALGAGISYLAGGTDARASLSAPPWFPQLGGKNTCQRAMWRSCYGETCVWELGRPPSSPLPTTLYQGAGLGEGVLQAMSLCQSLQLLVPARPRGTSEGQALQSGGEDQQAEGRGWPSPPRQQRPKKALEAVLDSRLVPTHACPG